MRLIILAALAWLVGHVSPSHASSIRAFKVETVSYPMIEIVTDPIAPATVKNTWLRDTQADVRARTVRVDAVGLPMAIAFVVSSERIWLRSDMLDNNRRALSGFALVEGMLGELKNELGPPGSKVVIVTYEEQARVVLASTDSRQLPAHPLGVPEDFRRDGRNIEEGVRLALRELSTISTKRKLLVVIGDSQATDAQRTHDALYPLSLNAIDDGIDVAAITYPLDYEGEPPAIGDVLSGVIATPKVVTTVSEAVSAMRKFIANTRESYRIEFDATPLTWNGKEHRIQVGAGEVTFYTAAWVRLPTNGPQREHELSPWRWPLLLMAIGVLGVLVFVLRR